MNFIVTLPPLVKAAIKHENPLTISMGLSGDFVAFLGRGENVAASGSSPELAISALESELGNREAQS